MGNLRTTGLLEEKHMKRLTGILSCPRKTVLQFHAVCWETQHCSGLGEGHRPLGVMGAEGTEKLDAHSLAVPDLGL